MVTVNFDPEGNLRKWNSINTKVLESIDKRSYKDAGTYAIKAYEFAVSVDNPQWIANSLNNLGQIMCATNNYEDAEHTYKRALQIILDYYGKDCLDAAMVVSNLATLHYEKGNYRLAEAGYLEAIRIKKMNLPPDHHSLEKTILNLAQMYKKTGYTDRAERLLETELHSNNRQSWRP